MEKRKLVILLLVIAIVLSAINIVVSLGFDELVPAGGGARIDNTPDHAAATLGVDVGEPGGGGS